VNLGILKRKMNSMHHFLTPPNAALDNLSGEIRNEVEFNLLAE